MTIGTPAARYPLARPARLGLDAFAALAGLHPDVVHRFVALGLLDPSRDSRGRIWFTPAELRTVARIRRLRAGLPVNYAALGLVLELLDRIDVLETALRRTGTRPPAAVRPPPSTARFEE